MIFCRRFTLIWLQDVSYTLKSEHDYFKPNRVRKHVPKPNVQSDNEFILPENATLAMLTDLLNGIISPKKSKKKRGNIKKSLVALIKRNQLPVNVPGGLNEENGQNIVPQQSGKLNSFEINLN